jgi:ATP-dependent Clp protease ATP-binding subunit ClpB
MQLSTGLSNFPCNFASQVHVPEPSMADTVSILRGLKGRYESHHAVRILDDALVAAARLSDRYISARFNPDKSIDLVDEAAAGVRVELDSQPEAIEKLEAAVLQAEIESAALAREAKTDAAAAQRLKVVQAGIARKREKLLTLRARHELQKELIANMSAVAKEVLCCSSACIG